ncbi:MAG: hypothetical protein WC408_00295 [Candidatus Micrarchaeia archaeon]|jgi:TM2 domain-containing membrane protein YozV
MNFLPKDDVSRFQVFAILFLASCLASTFISLIAFVVTLVVFSALCIYFAKPLPQNQRGSAYVLFGIFSLFGIGTLIAGQAASNMSDLIVVLPSMAVGFLVIFVIVKMFLVPWKVECKIIGYSEGYAIVETKPTVLSVLAPGVYAIKSKPVRKGALMRLVMEHKLFGASTKPIALESAAA